MASAAAAAGMIFVTVLPPTTRVSGQLPLRGVNSGRDLAGTDLSFDIIQGVPFRWTRLQTTNITGTIHWLGQALVLGIVAVVFVVTSAIGFCPAYLPFKISTCRK